MIIIFLKGGGIGLLGGIILFFFLAVMGMVDNPKDAILGAIWGGISTTLMTAVAYNYSGLVTPVVAGAIIGGFVGGVLAVLFSGLFSNEWIATLVFMAVSFVVCFMIIPPFIIFQIWR